MAVKVWMSETSEKRELMIELGRRKLLTDRILLNVVLVFFFEPSLC